MSIKESVSILIILSYVCGEKWVNRNPTCRCTEADLTRRDREIQERMAAFDAEQRAEEEEIRAAIAAVEAAERVIQLEREEEEARLEDEAHEIERLEQERLSNIADYYEHLRGVLESIRLHQRKAIEKRHEREWAEIDEFKDELESAEKVAERERNVNAEREKILASTEGNIRNLQRQHATIMMETITRHRRAQDDLLATPLSDVDADADTLKAETLEQLMLAQELERSTLKSQQAREIQKWKARSEQALKQFDSKREVLQLRLRDLEGVGAKERELKLRVRADSKWFDLLFLERVTMLSEDERRMMRTGAEAPTSPTKATAPPKSAISASKTDQSPDLRAEVSALSLEEQLDMFPNAGAPVSPSRPAPQAPGAQSMREQLGMSLHSETRYDAYRRLNRRGGRFEPDWEELQQIASPGARGGHDMRATWKRPGSSIRVG